MTTTNLPSETSLTAQGRGPEANPQLRDHSIRGAGSRQLPKAHANRNRAFLRRLRRSQAGNVMMLTAAAIVPLIAMIGGAVDMSRVYLTKSRLQQACDAGALAARQSMIGVTFDPATNGKTADDFFKANFPTGRYGAGGLAADYSANSAGAVEGKVKVSVPMTLMSFFNVPEWTLSATCTADVNLPNTDVMLVLDTTWSMKDTNAGDSTPRIEALKTAVEGFHTALQGLASAGGSQVRYGFVPFSQTVNVGKLLKPEWIADSAKYDSRSWVGTDSTGIAQHYSDPKSLGGTKTPTESPAGLSAERCSMQYLDKKSNFTKTLDKTLSTNWTPPGDTYPKYRKEVNVYNGYEYSVRLNTSGVCILTTTTYNNYKEQIDMSLVKEEGAGTKIQLWTYAPITYTLDSLKKNGSMVVPKMNDDGTTSRTIAWSGNNQNALDDWNDNACIEERATAWTSTSGDAFDMDIDKVPDGNPDTRWKPYLPGLIYGRNAFSPDFTAESEKERLSKNTNSIESVWTHSVTNTSTELARLNVFASLNYYTPSTSTYANQYNSCPAPSRLLAPINSGDLSRYLDKLQPTGFTYPDIGFLWGLRLMSPTGLFKADHEAAERKSGNISRHVIFMTDGLTDTRIGAYDAWGVSAVARRRTDNPEDHLPTDEEQNALTNERLLELCTTAKNKMNITVWVIAFGDEVLAGGGGGIPPLLEECASPGRAYSARNSAQLNAAFTDISSKIAALRITR